MYKIWKSIKEYDNLYLISNHGIVKIIKIKNNLKPEINVSGYLRVGLSKNGIRKHFLVHRLVAIAFIPNPDNKPLVNHKDGIKANNRVDNLEWVTSSESLKHAYRIGLKNPTSLKGETNPNHKLTENQVLSIHGLYLSGMKQKEIAKLYKIQ